MAMETISGRNGGYPCVAELPELSEIPDSKPPYPQFMLRTITGRNRGYPVILPLPELSEIPDSKPPYPDMLMRCLGEAVNGGYPVITALGNVKRRIFSKLYFADKNVCGMYLNGQFIASAFCGGHRVFGILYET